MGRVLRVASVGALVAIVAACGRQPVTHTLQFVGQNRDEDVQITLTDRAGIVLDLKQEVHDGDVEVPVDVRNVPGRLDQVRVLFFVQDCVRAATMELRTEGSGLRLSIAPAERRAPCADFGVGRELTITFAWPVLASAVEVDPAWPG